MCFSYIAYVLMLGAVRRQRVWGSKSNPCHWTCGNF